MTGAGKFWGVGVVLEMLFVFGVEGQGECATSAASSYVGELIIMLPPPSMPASPQLDWWYFMLWESISYGRKWRGGVSISYIYGVHISEEI